MGMARCSRCAEKVICGDDYKTNTKYKEEDNVGNRQKVILLQIYDMLEIDNLQKAEIKALINVLIDEHIEEFDEIDEKPYKPKKRKDKGK